MTSFQHTKPSEWLTDSRLTPQGETARAAYEDYCRYLDGLNLPSFQTARIKYFMQLQNYWTKPDGYALPPHTVNVCVNNYCNLKCKYCDFGQEQAETFYYKFNVIDHQKRIDLPFEVVRSVIDQVKWFRPIIRASYREPMLYKEIIPFIEYTKKAGLPFWLLTNGVLLGKHAKDLVRYGLDAVRMSLDGPEAIHDDMCAVKGTYRRMMDSVHRLMEEKASQKGETQVGFYFTIHDHNYDKIIETLEALEKEALLDKVFVNFQWLLYTSKNMASRHNREHAEISGGYIEESTLQHVQFHELQLDVMSRQAEEAAKRWPAGEGYRIHFRPSFDYEDLKRYRDTEDFPIDNPRCKLPWFNMNINPAGDVKAFQHCLLPTVGNVALRGFMDVWNGAQAREQRRKLQEHGAYLGCARCWGLYSLLEDEKRKRLENP